MRWLKEGDENTKFFHVVANSKKNKNFFPCLSLGNSRVVENERIGKVFISLFRSQFRTRREACFLFSWSKLLASKEQIVLSNLEIPFSLVEIKNATFDLGVDKAPRPDGFLISFFQKYWDTISSDLVKLCNDFYFKRVNLERINWASIALIPKVASPDNPADFRPISLINLTLKIILSFWPRVPVELLTLLLTMHNLCLLKDGVS